MRPNTSVNISSATATANGTVLDANQLVSISCQAVATGSIAGTLILEFSNDITPAVDANGNPAPTNWTAIPSATVSITGTAGVFGIPKTDLCYRWVRSQFTQSGGTGTLTCNTTTTGF